MQDQPDDPHVSQPTPATAVAAGRGGYLVQAGVLLGVIVITAVITLWVSRDAERVGIEILVPDPAPVTFQVAGEVVRPGVYSLDGEPRIDDAIDAAGGFTSDADVDRLNLALRVRDGAKVVIPSLSSAGGADAGDTVGETAGGIAGDIVESGSADADSAEVTGGLQGLIDLNTAAKDQLIALPGIGEVRADSIIEWRTNNLINSVSDLLAISGIGPATVDSIRDHVIQP